MIEIEAEPVEAAFLFRVWAWFHESISFKKHDGSQRSGIDRGGYEVRGVLKNQNRRTKMENSSYVKMELFKLAVGMLVEEERATNVRDWDGRRALVLGYYRQLAAIHGCLPDSSGRGPGDDEPRHA